jgi:D-alanine-D-alanine ligase
VTRPVVAVLSGGISGEREVSQRSAAAVVAALEQGFDVELYDVASPAIPAGLDPSRHVIFSALHGVFGEDGGMQALLDAAGFCYAGSDAASSRLCMDKAATKVKAVSSGVLAPRDVLFSAEAMPHPGRLLETLGQRVVLKPNNEGSSIGLHFARGEAELQALLPVLSGGRWLAEQQITGRELTVGILHGRALGVVEVIPRSGRYDYESKYTKGLTEYRFPADLPRMLSDRVRRDAETVFQVCGCRDFARVDFMLSEEGEPFFLEINTLPGLTETSLLPKSAACEGMDFRSLARELITPAIRRKARSMPKETLT